MSNSQQKAIFVIEIGKPVELGKRDVPSPAAGEILVKVAAAMLLPHDTYGRDWGLFIGEKLPYILGSNIAGTIEKLGDDVHGFEVGDSVFGLSDLAAPQPDQAGLQEYAVLNANAMARTPSGFSHDQVATLPVNISTSWLALFGKSGLGFASPLAENASAAYDNSSQNLVILGGGASVGKFAVQLAALIGIGNIIVIAGPNNKDELLEMGATHIIDRHLPASELVEAVHAITGTEGVTHLYHCHGFDYALDAALLPTSGPSTLLSIHPIEEADAQGIKDARPECKAYMLEASDEMGALGDFWKEVPKWLSEGKLKPGTFRVIEGLDRVEEINEALDGYRDGKGPQVIVHS